MVSTIAMRVGILTALASWHISKATAADCGGYDCEPPPPPCTGYDCEPPPPPPCTGYDCPPPPCTGYDCPPPPPPPCTGYGCPPASTSMSSGTAPVCPTTTA
ncbi:MAG: hypothetical protein M4579_006226, partial [Chaenotheca gracillima]